MKYENVKEVSLTFASGREVTFRDNGISVRYMSVEVGEGVASLSCIDEHKRRRTNIIPLSTLSGVTLIQ